MPEASAAVLELPPPECSHLRDSGLLLRPFQPSDRDALWAAAQSDDIGRYTSIEWPFTPDAATRLIDDAAVAWRDGAAARFAIVDESAAGEGSLVGSASLLHVYPERMDAEIGYWLGPAGRGRGLARRSVALLCSWSFDVLGLQRLHLGVDLDNDASHAVAITNGFVAIGEELWRHPVDPSKDGPIVVYERLAPNRSR